MGDEWLGGIAGGLDALSQLLVQRKAEKLAREHWNEQIRQFNVQANERNRQHQADEDERLRWHTLQQTQREDEQKAKAQTRRDFLAKGLVEGNTPEGVDIGSTAAAAVRDLFGPGAIHTTAAFPGAPPSALPPGMLTPPTDDLAALPGGLMPNPSRPETNVLPGGGYGYREQRQKAQEALALAQAKADEARANKPDATSVFREHPTTGALERQSATGGWEPQIGPLPPGPVHFLPRHPPPDPLARELAQARLDEAKRKAEEGGQPALEQQYRTILARGLSNRSGGLGLEDAKVQQANHLLAMLEQGRNPQTGEYHIPAVMQEELALGLARLVSPNGQVGVELARLMNQPTAYGKMQALITYLTGQPQTGSTQDVFKMFADSIQRQGEVAEQNRAGEMRYLQGLAPTGLEETRREALEHNTLNPLRRSRTIVNQKTGQRRLQVSLDGGQSWK